MFDRYLVTGATGYLGLTVLHKLMQLSVPIRALVMPGDPLDELPEGIEKVFGSVEDPACLTGFFAGDLRESCLIHAAGIVSISSKPSDLLTRVNVNGTGNVLDAAAAAHVKKVIYVSSVHAIPETRDGSPIRECGSFSPERVVGAYAKSKAAATQLALDAAARGLDVTVVHPSGIIGPFDRKNGSVTATVAAYLNGKLPFAVEGGYDFVDVRDAADGVLACCDAGVAGECYILSGRYASILEILSTLKRHTNGRNLRGCLPIGVIRAIAPACEWYSNFRKRPPFLTPYSVSTLASGAVFSHEKATRYLRYHPRPLEETLRDMAAWLAEKGMVKSSH